MQTFEPDFKKVLGMRVLQLRHSAGLTQSALSQRCGIYRTYLSRIEAGAANPTIMIVAALAAALQVPISDLFLQRDEGLAAHPPLAGAVDEALE